MDDCKTVFEGDTIKVCKNVNKTVYVDYWEQVCKEVLFTFLQTFIVSASKTVLQSSTSFIVHVLISVDLKALWMIEVFPEDPEFGVLGTLVNKSHNFRPH